MTNTYNLRQLEPSDRNFILNSWLKSYRDSDYANFIPNDIYYLHHGLLLNHLLDYQKTILAVDATDPSVIFGWINFSDSNSINYIYLKYAFRRLGISKLLLAATHTDPELPIHTTHHAHMLKHQTKYKIIYNPYGLITGATK